MHTNGHATAKSAIHTSHISMKAPRRHMLPAHVMVRVRVEVTKISTAELIAGYWLPDGS